MLFAYLGPETFLPLTSVIATVVGGVLMFGNRIWTGTKALGRRAARLVRGGRAAEAPAGLRRDGRARLLGRKPHATSHAPSDREAA